MSQNMPADDELNAIIDKAMNRNGYYSEAMALLPEDTREFVETTSWAAELHSAKRKELIKAAINRYCLREFEGLIGEDEATPEAFKEWTNYTAESPTVKEHYRNEHREQLRQAARKRFGGGTMTDSEVPQGSLGLFARLFRRLRRSGSKADTSSLYGVPIKTANWVKDGDAVFMMNGVDAIARLDGTDKEARYTIKQPKMVIYHKGRIFSQEQVNDLVGFNPEDE